MSMSRAIPLFAILAAFTLAACGGDDEPAAEPADTQATQASAGASEKPERPEDKPKQGNSGEQARPGTEIVAADSQYGSILFNADDQAIYLFDKESSPRSECYGACAAAWPPVLTEGEPQAGSGVDQKLLGTTKRDDGTTQVTYAGKPLYYYVDDPPGQVLCHNVEEFGGLWLVVEPSGAAVQ